MKRSVDPATCQGVTEESEYQEEFPISKAVRRIDRGGRHASLMVHHPPWTQSSQCRSSTAPAGHILKNVRLHSNTVAPLPRNPKFAIRIFAVSEGRSHRALQTTAICF